MIMSQLPMDSGVDEKIGFVDLLNSLSALRSLTELDFQVINECFLIRNALKALIQYQDMESCSVFLLDDNELINAAGLDWDDIADLNCLDNNQRHLAQRFKMGEGLIGKAAETRALQHCRNCTTDPRFERLSGKSNKTIPGSLISTPIEVGSELIGVLNVSHPETNFFTAWHERLLLIFSSMMGHLILNRRLFHEMEEKVRQRTADLEIALKEAEALKERYEQLSLVDELTGLFNRRYFFSRADGELSNAIRYQQSLCLLLVDLDHFKLINDRYGHSIGDVVAKRVSGVLTDESRDGDIVARFGGDEFIILLPNTSCFEGVSSGERIREKIRAIKLLDSPNLKITVSIGVSCLDPEVSEVQTPTVSQLIKRADTALYTAKENGRNSVVTFAIDE